jgi:hypothetical protein
LTIIVGSLYYIYNKLANNAQISLEEFLQQLNLVLFKNKWTIPILLSFTLFNWLFEIFKWKLLANQVKKITIYQAAKQSFASHTVSIITPNRIGEYGGKALYYPNNKGKIVLLNLIGNLYQLFATILFGIIGIIFFINTYNIEIEPRRLRGIGYIIAFLILIFIANKNRKLFYFFDIEKVMNYVKKLALSIHLKISSLSIIRYLIFTHQFYFLMLLFGVEIEYQTILLLIFAMYFIASFIPSISIFDWAIKGSVAIYVFLFIDITELQIITIIMLMWLLNFALPAIIGCFYVLNFKPQERK